MVTARATTMGKTQMQLKFILPHLEDSGEVGYTTRIRYGGYVPVKRPKSSIKAGTERNVSQKQNERRRKTNTSMYLKA